MGNSKLVNKEVKNTKTNKKAKTGTKLLPCKQCSKKFSQASNLYQHLHSAHESNKAFQVIFSYLYCVIFNDVIF